MGSGSVRWAFDVTSWKPTESQWLLAMTCIQAEEKDRIGRFVFKKDAKSSLIGRLLMRKYVAENSNIPYSQIKFDRDAKGKPFLDTVNSLLKINVSHQGRFAVLAGENSGINVGVDVMKMEYTGGKGIAEFFRLMTRHFSSHEWENIHREKSDDLKLGSFCRHWSLKESYVKATGTGITVDLQQISFQPKTNLQVGIVASDTLLYTNGVKKVDWCFEETLLDTEHCVSVALNKEKKCEGVPFQVLHFEELISGCDPLLPVDVMGCKNFFNKQDHPRSL